MKKTTTPLTTDEILKILLQVKKISEEKRNPYWGDNRKRKTGGRVCNNAAAASDLGATRRDQSMTKKLRQMVMDGLLREVPSPYGPGRAYFQLTESGRRLTIPNA